MNMQIACFENDIVGVGRFTLRTLQMPEDLPLVHRWVTHERARYWGLQNRSLDDVAEAYRNILAQPGSSVFLGFHGDAPAFLLECYHPLEDAVGRCTTHGRVTGECISSWLPLIGPSRSSPGTSSPWSWISCSAMTPWSASWSNRTCGTRTSTG